MRQQIRLSDYRSVSQRAEEVSVGAFARRKRRQRVYIALAGVALLLTAAVTYQALHPIFGVAPDDYPVLVRCVADKCGYSGVVRVRAAQAFPVTCPKCGQRSCRALWRCNDCKTTFLLDEGRAPACPKCRSQNVGSAAVAPASQPGGAPN